MWLDKLFIENSQNVENKQNVAKRVDYADWRVWEINKAAQMERLNKKQEKFYCTAAYVEFDEFARKKKIEFIIFYLLFTSSVLGNRREVYVIHSITVHLA